MLSILQVQQFYYVGLHQGISAAARAMPERRTPSAINKAMVQLEDAYGHPLFERTPFSFTRAGHEFWDFIRIFFERLDAFLAASQPRGCELRVGCAQEVARHYLSDLLELLRTRDASARVKLRCGSQSEMHTWLREGVIDVLIAPRVGPLAPKIACSELVRLPLVLLVPRRHRLTSAAELWARPTCGETLIVSNPAESVAVNFAAGLRAMNREWPPAIDADSLSTVAHFVAQGQGLGVVPDEPSLAQRPGVRALPLPGFAPVTMMAFWREPAQPLEQLLIDTLRHRAARAWPRARRAVIG